MVKKRRSKKVSVTTYKGKKIQGKIFAKTSSSAFITSDENDYPVFESPVKTYRLTKARKGNKFILYQMNRKRPPQRVKTIRGRKGDTISSVIGRIQADKIKINTKYKDVIYTSRGKTVAIQTNYNARIKAFPQLLGVVRVSDTRRHISDHFVGYSKKIPSARLSRAEINNAKLEIIDMAIGKFITVHGIAKNSGDIDAIIIEMRYQYWKKSFKNG